jgi:hypothetical protein
VLVFRLARDHAEFHDRLADQVGIAQVRLWLILRSTGGGLHRHVGDFDFRLQRLVARGQKSVPAVGVVSR